MSKEILEIQDECEKLVVGLNKNLDEKRQAIGEQIQAITKTRDNLVAGGFINKHLKQKLDDCLVRLTGWYLADLNRTSGGDNDKRG